MRNFSIVVATDADGGIGKSGGLPWQLPGDMKYFRELTSTAQPGKINAVIMGRTTWESIPEKFRPLPHRLNVVLTRKPNFQFPQGVLSAEHFQQAFELIENAALAKPIDRIFVIGGAQVYTTALNYKECRELYITEIDQTFVCDAFFPDMKADFKLSQASDARKEGAITYRFCMYVRQDS